MIDADKPAFLQAFNRMAVALREPAPDTTTLRVYFEGLRDREIEFVLAAADRLIAAKWFPKLSEWRDVASTVEVECFEKQQAMLRKLPQPLCAACDDTGWELGTADDRGYSRVKRCECRKLRRLELLGRAPPAALPEPVIDPGQEARVLSLVKPLAAAHDLHDRWSGDGDC